MRRYRHLRHAGLTLIELLVVMMILVILAGSISLYVVNKADQARVARVKSDMKTFETALESYYLVMGEYPTTEQGLPALAAPQGVDEQRWRQGGPFIKLRNFNDPWGNEFVYRAPGLDGRDYDILSYGADGREGGEDKNADIVSWDIGE